MIAEEKAKRFDLIRDPLYALLQRLPQDDDTLYLLRLVQPETTAEQAREQRENLKKSGY